MQSATRQEKRNKGVAEQHGYRGIEVGEHAYSRRFYAPFHALCTEYGAKQSAKKNEPIKKNFVEIF